MSAKHENINDEVKEQKQKFRDMTPRKKWEYFWEYYRIHTIVGILSLIVIVTFAKDMIEGNKEGYLHVAMINGYPSIDTTTFMSDFAASVEVDPAEYDVSIDANYQFSTEDMSQMIMASTQKLVTMVSAKAIDVFLSDISAIENYARSGFYANLNTVLPQELIEKYSDSFYYYTYDPANEPEEGLDRGPDYKGPYDTLEPVPVAIIATDFAKLTELGAYAYQLPSGDMVTPYFAVCSNTQHPENTVTFLEYLNKE